MSQWCASERQTSYSFLRGWQPRTQETCAIIGDSSYATSVNDRSDLHKRSHIVVFEDAAALTFEEIERRIDPGSAIKLDEIRLSDLILYPGTGIYLFYDAENKRRYIGSCLSRSFIERIPSHFDTRRGASLNTVSKRMAVSEETVNDDLTSIVMSALPKLKLILIGIPCRSEHDKMIVRKVERDLIVNLGPDLNHLSHKRRG